MGQKATGSSARVLCKLQIPARAIRKATGSSGESVDIRRIAVAKGTSKAKQEPGKKRPCFANRARRPVHFVKAADRSCRLEEGCSSARRAPSSYNDSSSFPQQSAGYEGLECISLFSMNRTADLTLVDSRGDRLSTHHQSNMAVSKDNACSCLCAFFG